MQPSGAMHQSHQGKTEESWNVSEKDEEKIILKLTEEKFLDDGRYAGFYAKDKFKFNAWGRIQNFPYASAKKNR